MKLNVACGDKVWDGWVNSDINPPVGAERIDLRDRPLPYDDDSADLLMMSNAIQMGEDQRALGDIPGLFSEFHRILKPGGWLRLDEHHHRVYGDGNRDGDDGRGFPPELRIHRDKFAHLLLDAGFAGVKILEDPEQTTIPASDEDRDAIVRNHEGHASVAFEAQK